MKVRFYTFSKKYNSTAQPSTGYTEYECVIKSSSDVITPTVELQIGLSTNPSSFNYCYIPDYNRYYWVKDWTFYNHLWIATLNVDVLATWKPYIGNTSMFVYRASNEYNGAILDNKYPTTSNITIDRVQITALGKKFSDGYFVVGVYGDNTNSTTMAYYSIKAEDFGDFIKAIFTNGVNGNNWSGLGVGIRNAIFDISAFIKSCTWYPYDPGDLSTASGTIQVGVFNITCDNCRVLDTTLGYSFSYGARYAIPKHPQARTRGSYCNLSPYSSYKLTLLPFGVFALDSTLLCNYSHFGYVVYVDAISGMGVVSIYVCEDVTGTNAKTVITKTCKYGVDIPISVSQTDIASVASSLAGAGISRLHGNVFSRSVSAVSSVAELAQPAQDAISDSMGSILGIDYVNNSLTGIFYELTDEDITSNGRPLYKVRTPANLGGYIEAESNEFSAPATIDEMEEIKRFIDNGFYYE